MGAYVSGEYLQVISAYARDVCFSERCLLIRGLDGYSRDGCVI